MTKFAFPHIFTMRRPLSRSSAHAAPGIGKPDRHFHGRASPAKDPAALSASVSSPVVQRHPTDEIRSGFFVTSANAVFGYGATPDNIQTDELRASLPAGIGVDRHEQIWLWRCALR